MKNQWNDPKILNLDVQETFGGPSWDDEPDSELVWDEVNKKWKRSFGTDS